MSQRVSIIQHFTGDLTALGLNLADLHQELTARGAGDEMILVDDTAQPNLEAWLREHYPWVRLVQKNRQEGRSKAQLLGAQAASGEFLLLLGPQMRVARGALGPLIAAMSGPNVFAVAPRIVNAVDGEVELPGALAMEQGRPVVLPSPIATDEGHLRPIPFASGAALFVRREAFLARAGFEDLFPTPYWDDVDMGLTAWRQGLRILEVPQAVVERHPIDHPEVLTPPEVDRAAIERGRLHLYWKHLDNKPDAQEHVQALWRDTVDAALHDRREELVWLAMALEDLDEVTTSRSRVKGVQVGWKDALRASDPTRL